MHSSRLRLLFVSVLAMKLLLSGCSQEARPQNTQDQKENLIETEDINSDEAREKPILPAVKLGESTLAEVIYQRKSHRSYGERALNLSEIGNLLWAAGGLSIDGVTGPTRTYPSAGGAYPLDIYLVAGEVVDLTAGVYRYDYAGHLLIPVITGDVRERLSEAALGQDFIANAAASIVLVAHYERTKSRYGERGERYVHMDTGYASQNIYLAATGMGLGTVAVGAFDDSALADLIQTDGDPLMIMPVGDVNP